MSWGSLTTEEVDHIYYLAGHLMSSETLPDDPHAGDSRDLALDGFANLKNWWRRDAQNKTAENIARSIEKGRSTAETPFGARCDAANTARQYRNKL